MPLLTQPKRNTRRSAPLYILLMLVCSLFGMPLFAGITLHDTHLNDASEIETLARITMADALTHKELSFPSRIRITTCLVFKAALNAQYSQAASAYQTVLGVSAVLTSQKTIDQARASIAIIEGIETCIEERLDRNTYFAISEVFGTSCRSKGNSSAWCIRPLLDSSQYKPTQIGLLSEGTIMSASIRPNTTPLESTDNANTINPGTGASNGSNALKPSGSGGSETSEAEVIDIPKPVNVPCVSNCL